MEGKEVFKHAVVDDHRRDQGCVQGDRLYRATISTGSCRIRPIGASSTDRCIKLGIDPAKVVITVDRHGNTSAASIPLALCAGIADGRIKKGDLVMFEAMGGGFTWGASLVRM